MASIDRGRFDNQERDRGMIKLRPYQESMIDSVRNSYRDGNQRVLVVSPTGSGKTVVFCYIAQQARANRRRTMILVHRQELVDQTSRTLTAFDVPHGVIAAGRTSDGSELIQVASVQTLIRRIDRIMDPDLIVIDEAHHAIAGSWRKVVERFTSARVLGVTATPERLDGKGLRDVFSDLVRGPEVRDLVRDGHLSAPVYYAPPQHIDMASVQLRRGDYDQKGLESVMDAPKITGDAVDHYRRICAGKPAVVFCVSIAHAEHVAEEFRRAGFRAATIDGTLSPEDRRDRVRSLGNGRLQVLTSCEIINEGFDLPIVSVGILLRPTQSLGLHLQQIGRVLRPAPGKDRAVILDHAGNLARHGLAEDVRDWSLDGAEKRKKKAKAEDTIKTRQCPECFACHPWAASCPECGNEYVTDGRQIEVVGGDLVAIDTRFQQCPGCQHVHSRWDASCPKCGMVHDPVRARKKEQGRAQTLDELVELGKRRGYKNPYGWARHTWIARNGNK